MNVELTPETIENYCTAGNAILIVTNDISGNTLKFRIWKNKKATFKQWYVYNFPYGLYLGKLQYGIQYSKDELSFYPSTFDAGQAQILIESINAFKAIWQRIALGKWEKTLHFYHTGVCGKCGRELTDPTSILLGIGPTCRGAK